MKKINYKGICLGAAVVLCLALIAGCLVPLSAAAAETAAAAEQDSVHFIKPTAITVVDNFLYVADIVENGKTAILCFDLSSNTPTLKYTCEIEGETTKLSYGVANDGTTYDLYAICGTKVIVLSLEDKSQPKAAETYNFDNEVSGFVKGTFGPQKDRLLFALTNKLLRHTSTNSFANLTPNDLNETKGCVSVGDVVFFVHKTGDKFVCGGYTSEGTYLVNTITITTEPVGITAYQDKVAFYSQHSILYVDTDTMYNWTHDVQMQGNELKNLISDTGDKTILDVAINNDTIFVLNDNINKIDMYVNGGANGYYVAYTIGSDTVNKAVPTAYTSFTTVRPNGYPANIVYKTNTQDSVSEIITDAKEYVILGYDGDKDSHYYYVLIGDKFGWVKKGDGASTPADDDKLSVVKNQVSGNEFVEAHAKFVSLNAVYIYELPLESADKTTINQTATTMKDVTVLQYFNEGNQVWYFVRYEDDKTGFVKKETVGSIHNVSKGDNIPSLGGRKINSSLFAPVYLHVTAELKDNDYVTDAEGNVIRLYSGDHITLVDVKDNAAFIMILHSNNSKEFGWIEASRLIDVHQITTNAIVGLSLLAAAITLATILLIVYFKRKKKIAANND